MSHKYKAKNGQKDFFISGVGASNADGILESEEALESPALVEVTEAETGARTPVAAPNAVIGVAPQATASSEPAPAPLQSEAQPQEKNESNEGAA